MEPVLQETYGIMVYQEQVMRLAADLAGFSLGEADTLRKAMGKKDRELMATQREKFISGCKANKIDARKAERIWDLIEKFAGYGFNKSHAACYGVVAYQTAYLKANYPTEFMAALLTSEMDKTDKIVLYVEETPRDGPARGAARRQRLPRRLHGGGGGDPLRPGRDQERGRHRDRVHRADRARRTAASPPSTTSAPASTCAW